MANVDQSLHRRLTAAIERHPDHHEAARTAIHAAVLAALRSVGPVQTADFLRDAADTLERHELVGLVLQ